MAPIASTTQSKGKGKVRAPQPSDDEEEEDDDDDDNDDDEQEDDKRVDEQGMLNRHVAKSTRWILN